MSQASTRTRMRWSITYRWLLYGAIIAVLLAVAASYRLWLPYAQQLSGFGARPPKAAMSEGPAEHEEDDHEGHNHPGHSDSESIELSEQARKNIGLKLATVELQPFTKTASVPGMVVERQGRSVINVSSPMTGIVTAIHIIEGEAVQPAQKLFELRLTHEELVQSQAELLQTAEEMAVTDQEIKRIEKLASGGAIPGRQLLERQYEYQKLEAVLRSKRQALLLHGLTDDQVENILEQRQLLQRLTVYAPAEPTGSEVPQDDILLQVQSLKVSLGQHVTSGDTLASLADHAQLYIEGEAFERDLAAVSRAAESQANVAASIETEEGKSELISGLRVLYVASTVNAETRTLDFFVTLPNEKQRDSVQGGHRFISWRFRPGQRVQLEIPTETLPERIVLPVDAVAQDGVETYVFTPNGDHLDRRTVHVEYRDARSAVIANDGSLFPGELVAISGAQQLQLALKNSAGGGVDPHAGHNH